MCRLVNVLRVKLLCDFFFSTDTFFDYSQFLELKQTVCGRRVTATLSVSVVELSPGSEIEEREEEIRN